MKIGLLHIIFLFICGTTFAQKPMVLIDVEPKEAEPGEILTITVKSNIQGELDIELPSGFVHGYNVMNGMEQEMDYNTGKLITYYYMSQTGAMSKEGSFVIGPAYIKKGSKVYRSNTVSVTIKKQTNSNQNSDEITAKQLRQPVFGVIECSQKTIYEGEPVILNAKVYAQFSPSHLENYQGYTISGVIDKHDIGNNQRILVEETKIKGVKLFSFSYDKNVVFPSATGKNEVEPYKLILRRGYESVPITSSGLNIEVKPLPSPPTDFIGGVGRFTVERSINETSINQGSVFKMLIKISGAGNLHNLVDPKIQLPKGFTIYGDPIVKEDISFTAKGAEGSISYEYNIQVTKFGDLELPEASFSYFDPRKERYVQMIASKQNLTVVKDIHFKVIPEKNETENIFVAEQKTSPMRANNGQQSDSTFYNSPVFWVGLGSPFILSLFLGLLFIQREQKQTDRTLKIEVKKNKDEANNLLIEAKSAYMAKDFTSYYSSIEKSIHKSISQLLYEDPNRIISKQEILEGLVQKNIDSHIIDRLKLILDRCEQERYGMGIENSEPTDLTDSVIVTLQSIQQA